jgi:hypothetical protein
VARVPIVPIGRCNWASILCLRVPPRRHIRSSTTLRNTPVVELSCIQGDNPTWNHWLLSNAGRWVEYKEERILPSINSWGEDWEPNLAGSCSSCAWKYRPPATTRALNSERSIEKVERTENSSHSGWRVERAGRMHCPEVYQSVASGWWQVCFPAKSLFPYTVDWRCFDSFWRLCAWVHESCTPNHNYSLSFRLNSYKLCSEDS